MSWRTRPGQSAGAGRNVACRAVHARSAPASRAMPSACSGAPQRTASIKSLLMLDAGERETRMKPTSQVEAKRAATATSSARVGGLPRCRRARVGRASPSSRVAEGAGTTEQGRERRSRGRAGVDGQGRGACWPALRTSPQRPTRCCASEVSHVGTWPVGGCRRSGRTLLGAPLHTGRTCGQGRTPRACRPRKGGRLHADGRSSARAGQVFRGRAHLRSSRLQSLPRVGLPWSSPATSPAARTPTRLPCLGRRRALRASRAQSRLGAAPPPAASTLGSGSDPADERSAIDPPATNSRRTSVKRMRAKDLAEGTMVSLGASRGRAAAPRARQEVDRARTTRCPSSRTARRPTASRRRSRPSCRIRTRSTSCPRAWCRRTRPGPSRRRSRWRRRRPR